MKSSYDVEAVEKWLNDIQEINEQNKRFREFLISRVKNK